MSSKNVETVRAAHESWNRRDFPGVIRDSIEGLVYTDHGRSLTLKTRDRFREWTEGWAEAFSDGKITDPKYIDGGDVVVTQFTAKAQTTGHWDRFRLPDVRYRSRSARSVISTNKDASCRGTATTINTHF